jgi:hypothetical protein
MLSMAKSNWGQIPIIRIDIAGGAGQLSNNWCNPIRFESYRLG